MEDIGVSIDEINSNIGQEWNAYSHEEFWQYCQRSTAR